MPLFPPEIIHDTTEFLFVKRTVRSQAIYLVVVFAVVASIAALPFIYVQISTQARGILRSPNENNPLQMAVYGEITEIRMTENTEVKLGDTLLVLNTENIQVQIDRLEEKIEEDLAFINDIAALLTTQYDSLKTPKYMNEKNWYQTSISEQQIKINYLKHELAVTEELYRKHVTPQSEYLQYKNNYETAVRQRDNTREQFRNRWQSEQTNYKLEINGLQSEIRRLDEEKTKYVLRAPVSGSVIQLSGVRPGSFIAPGQSIGSISDDNDLLVECYISPSDIGYIHKNQQVAFQLDAFNLKLPQRFFDTMRVGEIISRHY
jgi:HlyD family secretion protein